MGLNGSLQVIICHYDLLFLFYICRQLIGG